MDRVTHIKRPVYILERLNDVRLYLKVSRLSDRLNAPGSEIEYWALYGPPAESLGNWPKRRKSLAENMRFLRETIRIFFCGMQGIHPAYLGMPLPQPNTRKVLAPMATITSVFDQYPSCYRQLLGKDNIGDTQANEILGLLRSGALYAVRDFSVNDG